MSSSVVVCQQARVDVAVFVTQCAHAHRRHVPQCPHLRPALPGYHHHCFANKRDERKKSALRTLASMAAHVNVRCCGVE
jgi:hypothetical protein